MPPENKFDNQTEKQLTAAEFNVLFNDHMSVFYAEEVGVVSVVVRRTFLCRI